MAAAAAAEVVSQRLSRQEQELLWLTAEVAQLKGQEAPGCPASCSPELQRLRAENEKLRYRLLHLRRSLAVELGRAEPAESPAGDEVASGVRTPAGPSSGPAGEGGGLAGASPGLCGERGSSRDSRGEAPTPSPRR